MSNGIIEDEATIPGNGEIIPPESASAGLFVPNGLDKIIAEVRRRVEQHQPDISTEKGRAAIKSLAYWVSKQGAKVEDYGKKRSMAIKVQAVDIDAERKRGKEIFAGLRDQARKPLDDYEAALAARLEAHEKALSEVLDLSNPPFGANSAEIERRIAKLDEYALRSWEEFADRFGIANAATSLRLNRLLTETKAQEEQRLAYAKLEAEQKERDSAAAKERQEREQAERDERIAREATDRAEMAAQEREAQYARDKQAAEARAAKAEQDAKDAAAKAVRDQEAAVEAERQRAERVRLAEEAATKAREANQAHKLKIDKAIIVALSSLGVSTEHARAITTALSEGKIPNVKVNY